MEAASFYLTELLCSRICHDLASPLSIISGSLEVLGESQNQQQSLYRNSLIAVNHGTDRAVSILQYYRIGFGLFDSGAGNLPLNKVRSLVDHFFDGEKVKIRWEVPWASFPLRVLSKESAKILFNTLLLAQEALPRGGELRIDFPLIDNGEEGLPCTVHGEGEEAYFSEEFLQVLKDPEAHLKELTARTVQAAYIVLLCRSLRIPFEIMAAGREVKAATLLPLPTDD